MPHGSPRQNYRPPRPAKPSLFDAINRSGTIRCTDGIPQVDHLPHDLISQHGEPYMHRYFLLGSQTASSARYHHIVHSDRHDLHDHPWDFISVILQGSYLETTPTREQQYHPGDVLVRTAEQLHRLTLLTPSVWTFVTVSTARKTWGYQTDNGWVPWRAYLGTPSRW
jgi:quercetin dioxygenase-like cupin family protein